MGAKLRWIICGLGTETAQGRLWLRYDDAGGDDRDGSASGQVARSVWPIETIIWRFAAPAAKRTQEIRLATKSTPFGAGCPDSKLAGNGNNGSSLSDTAAGSGDICDGDYALLVRVNKNTPSKRAYGCGFGECVSGSLGIMSRSLTVGILECKGMLCGELLQRTTSRTKS
jgi:hypothetical protein